jgi:hypothetical protein
MDWDGKQPRFKNFPRTAPQPKTFVINGEEYLRVVFGLGPHDYDYATCFCGVTRNTTHKLGCRFEPCPRCDEQAISCDCSYQDD